MSGKARWTPLAVAIAASVVSVPSLLVAQEAVESEPAI